MNTSEFFKKVEDIAKNLDSKEWRFNHLIKCDKDRFRWPQLVGDHGQRVVFSLDEKREKATCFGLYPKNLRSRDLNKYPKFTITKDSHLIARDIKKRYLDAYKEEYKKILHTCNEKQKEDEQIAVYIDLLRQHIDIGSVRGDSLFSCRSFYGDIEVFSEYVNLEFNRIPKDTAFKVLMLLESEANREKTINSDT